ncbi:MAG: methyltransferase domain-containing protein, partial [Elusimicrobia bacterium]|nr:methyltransferase domain-containing protein [Elusimicrobiota bacterium]
YFSGGFTASTELLDAAMAFTSDSAGITATGREMVVTADFRNPQIDPDDVQMFLYRIQNLFFQRSREHGLLPKQQSARILDVRCILASHILANVIAHEFGVPIGGDSPHRVDIVEGTYLPDGSTHYWLALYAGDKTPVLLIDGSYGQFNHLWERTIIAEKDYTGALIRRRLKDRRHHASIEGFYLPAGSREKAEQTLRSLTRTDLLSPDRAQTESVTEIPPYETIRSFAENHVVPRDQGPVTVQTVMETELPAALHTLKNIQDIRREMDTSDLESSPLIIWQNMRLGEFYPYFNETLKSKLDMKEVTREEYTRWLYVPGDIPPEVRHSRYLLVKDKIASSFPAETGLDEENWDPSVALWVLKDMERFARALSSPIVFVDHSNKSFSLAQQLISGAKRSEAILLKDPRTAVIQAAKNIRGSMNALLLLNAAEGARDRKAVSLFDDIPAFLDRSFDGTVTIAGETLTFYDAIREAYGEAINLALTDQTQTGTIQDHFTKNLSDFPYVLPGESPLDVLARFKDDRDERVQIDLLGQLARSIREAIEQNSDLRSNKNELDQMLDLLSGSRTPHDASWRRSLQEAVTILLSRSASFYEDFLDRLNRERDMRRLLTFLSILEEMLQADRPPLPLTPQKIQEIRDTLHSGVDPHQSWEYHLLSLLYLRSPHLTIPDEDIRFLLSNTSGEYYPGEAAKVLQNVRPERLIPFLADEGFPQIPRITPQPAAGMLDPEGRVKALKDEDPELYSLLFDPDNARKVLAIPTRLRRIWPYENDKIRRGLEGPLAWALQNNILYPLGNGLFISPVTESFRRHLILRLSPTDEVERVLEIKVPGSDTIHRIVEDNDIMIASALRQHWQESRITPPVAFLSLPQGTYTLYGQAMPFGPEEETNTSCNMAVFEYQDGRRLTNLDPRHDLPVIAARYPRYQGNPQAVALDIAHQSYRFLAMAHLSGYRGSHETGTDAHLENLRAVLGADGIEIVSVDDLFSFELRDGPTAQDLRFFETGLGTTPGLLSFFEYAPEGIPYPVTKIYDEEQATLRKTLPRSSKSRDPAQASVETDVLVNNPPDPLGSEGIHVRPSKILSLFFMALKETYPGIEVEITSLSNDASVDPTNTMSWLTAALYHGTSIRLKLSSRRYQEENLTALTELIRSILSDKELLRGNTAQPAIDRLKTVMPQSAQTTLPPENDAAQNERSAQPVTALGLQTQESDPEEYDLPDDPNYDRALRELRLSLEKLPRSTGPALDLGAGSGALTRVLLQSGAPSVIALDNNEKMLSELIRYLPLNERKRVTPLTGDILNIKQGLASIGQNGPFSLITIGYVLHTFSLEDKGQILRQARGLLASGGSLAILLRPIDEPLSSSVEKLDVQETYARILKRTGFKNIHIDHPAPLHMMITAQAPSDGAQDTRPRLLVLDDKLRGEAPLYLQTVRQRFPNHEVIPASSLAQAVRIIEENPSFDIVLSDYDLGYNIPDRLRHDTLQGHDGRSARFWRAKTGEYFVNWLDRHPAKKPARIILSSTIFSARGGERLVLKTLGATEERIRSRIPSSVEMVSKDSLFAGLPDLKKTAEGEAPTLRSDIETMRPRPLSTTIAAVIAGLLLGMPWGRPEASADLPEDISTIEELSRALSPRILIQTLSEKDWQAFREQKGFPDDVLALQESAPAPRIVLREKARLHAAVHETVHALVRENLPPGERVRFANDLLDAINAHGAPFARSVTQGIVRILRYDYNSPSMFVLDNKAGTLSAGIAKERIVTSEGFSIVSQREKDNPLFQRFLNASLDDLSPQEREGLIELFQADGPLLSEELFAHIIAESARLNKRLPIDRPAEEKGVALNNHITALVRTLPDEAWDVIELFYQAIGMPQSLRFRGDEEDQKTKDPSALREPVIKDDVTTDTNRASSPDAAQTPKEVHDWEEVVEAAEQAPVVHYQTLMA